MVWRVPLLPWAKTWTSSALKPAFFSLSENCRSALADQTASTPLGRRALAQALRPAGGVKPAVGPLGQAFGAVVDVEHDRVKTLRLCLQDLGHVFQADHRARVLQRVSGFFAQRSAVPLHHAWHQFGDYHFSGLAQVLERRGEGETHAQAPDQHP